MRAAPRVRQLQTLAGRRTLCSELAAERFWRNEVDEGAAAVDLHHRQVLAIARFQLCISRDVDLGQLEAELGA
jgi:hypothetical protein